LPDGILAMHRCSLLACLVLARSRVRHCVLLVFSSILRLAAQKAKLYFFTSLSSFLFLVAYVAASAQIEKVVLAAVWHQQRREPR
jgi:hypothetical protein